MKEYGLRELEVYLKARYGEIIERKKEITPAYAIDIISNLNKYKKFIKDFQEEINELEKVCKKTISEAKEIHLD